MRLQEAVFNCRLSLYGILPINKRKIVFLSHLGKTYACNPRYLCEYLASEYPGRFDLVWVYNRLESGKPELPAGVRAVPYFSHQYLKEINTAGFIISNTRIADAFYFNKRKGQTYIQLWHSSIRLKCIEADAGLGREYQEFACRDSKKIDIIFSGGSFSTKIFRNSFWYDGAIVESGTPRIDWLLNLSDKEIDRIHTKANLDSNINYLLYAPTFRKDGSLHAYDIDFKNLIDALQKRFGGKWRILYRLHPNLKGAIKPSDLCEAVMDFTDYDDIQELLAISKILITDYSSSMFDAAFCSKPCILYASDLKEYTGSDRNLYFKIEELPFPLVQNNEELVEAIQAFDPDQYKQSIDTFMSHIGSCEDGNSCRRITEYILNKS